MGDRSPVTVPAVLSSMAAVLVVVCVVSPVLAPSMYGGLTEPLVAGGLLAPVWLILMAGGIRDGQMPETANVLVLDLGFIFPAMITAIVGLVRRREWAWPLAGSLVILTAAMLGSLVVADVIAALSDVTADPLALVFVFGALAAAALGASWDLLRRLRR